MIILTGGSKPLVYHNDKRGMMSVDSTLALVLLLVNRNGSTKGYSLWLDGQEMRLHLNKKFPYL